MEFPALWWVGEGEGGGALVSRPLASCTGEVWGAGRGELGGVGGLRNVWIFLKEPGAVVQIDRFELC